jgi:hypothetical protein
VIYSQTLSGGCSTSFVRERLRKSSSTGQACLIKIPPFDGQQATRAPFESIVKRLVGRYVRPLRDQFQDPLNSIERADIDLQGF